ncbi:MAG: hypothetical protein GDA56_20885 [Hormoscilla sp. GM7CHS1pb]|nr:hypothetical protein [Hormoscilla sp. GM7CHS1pb]
MQSSKLRSRQRYTHLATDSVLVHLVLVRTLLLNAMAGEPTQPTFGDIQYAPLTGHYHKLDKDTLLPEGLDVVADGRVSWPAVDLVAL